MRMLLDFAATKLSICSETETADNIPLSGRQAQQTWAVTTWVVMSIETRYDEDTREQTLQCNNMAAVSTARRHEEHQSALF